MFKFITFFKTLTYGLKNKQERPGSPNINVFFTRAGAIKPDIEGFKNIAEKTKYFKKITQKIKRDGATVINQAGLEDHLPSEMIMKASDPEAILEFHALMSSESILNKLHFRHNRTVESSKNFKTGNKGSFFRS